jgi:hypothetical protein
MRYIVGLGALAILALVAWAFPPGASTQEPLLSGGFMSFVAGWMFITIPLAFTVAILAGAWLAFSAGMAKMSKAQHPKVPERLTVTYSPHQRTLPTPAALPAPAIDVTPPALDVPSFSALLDRGMVARGQPLILGYTQQGMLTGSWRDLYSSAIAGLSGSGKTSTVRLLACQSAVHGAKFVVIDPHADAGDESLAATLGPLQASMLCEPADTERSIRDAARLVQTRMEARLHGDRDRTPLLLCIDEFTRLMRSPALAPQLAGLVEAIGQEGRKVGIFAMLSGQIWTSERSGGSALRDSLASVYCHRLRRNQARLLLSTEEARQAEALGVGEALLLRTSGECERVALPLATAPDVERVGALLAMPAQPSRNGRAIEDSPSGRPTPTAKEAQVISMLQSGATMPEVVKALYGETGKAYTDGVRDVSRIVGQALRHHT